MYEQNVSVSFKELSGYINFFPQLLILTRKETVVSQLCTNHSGRENKLFKKY